MPMRNFIKRTALAVAVSTLSAVSAVAQTIDVKVYTDGYLPNILYMGNATAVRFVNMTGGTLGIDYINSRGGYSIMVNDISAYGNHTVSRSDLNGRTFVQPYVFSSGNYPGAGRFEIRDGDPPLQ